MTTNTDRLSAVLGSMGTVTIAVSGGVDSMTLACFTHREFGAGNVRMVHATSPAVPADAGQRIAKLAESEAWQIDIVDAGEFADPDYRANPINRCFFCKSNLYQTLGAMSDGIVLSGTNTDDLGDYRPGLEAARIHNVRHPYVEADFDKNQVRALADQLGLREFARLPASPCLSSRVETGLPIEADVLGMIDAVESWCRNQLRPETVRCRIRRSGLVIEMDARAHAGIKGAHRIEVIENLRKMVPGVAMKNIAFAEYVRGSAFVGDRTIRTNTDPGP